MVRGIVLLGILLGLGCCGETDRAAFRWQAGEAGRLLCQGDRPVLEYVNGYDPSTPESLLETYKPYYHLFDGQGKFRLTKGSGGLYTHHRGLFIGWNRLTFEGKEYDFWHMKDTVQREEKVLEETGGPAKGRLVSLIRWDDGGGRTLIEEERGVTVYDGGVIDFTTRLRAVAGDVLLNGDPEHGGFQFRAHNEVAEGGEEVKAAYLFPAEDVDPAKDNDLSWAAMTVGLRGRKYTIQHMNHPENPKGTVYSAYRDYGRFGAFFVQEIKAGETLALKYRIVLIEGDAPPREVLEKNYQDFVQGKTPAAACAGG